MEAFKKFGIIPDVIDDLPESLLEVTWKDSNVKADRGNVLEPEQMKNKPSMISWKDADPTVFYTLMMVDPDAPSRYHPKFREWQHWLIVNIPGDEVSKGQVKTEYYGPSPPKETGLHRYVWLLYEQDEKRDFHDVLHLPVSSTQHRVHFNARTFAQKHNFVRLVAANFIQSEYIE